jgi:hypothetical protein
MVGVASLGMEISNIHRVPDVVTDLARSTIGVREGMLQLLDACAEIVPDPVWDELRSFDFESDVRSVREWISIVLIEQPLPDGSVAYYIGLAELVDGDTDGAVGAMEFCATDHFDLNDERFDWATNPRYVADC